MLCFFAVHLKPHQTNVFTTHPWSIFSPGFLPFEAQECAGVSELISPQAWPHLLRFPGGSVVENLPAIAGDLDSIPGSGRSPGEGKGSRLQYFCLENPMDRGSLAGSHPQGCKETWLSKYPFSLGIENTGSRSTGSDLYSQVCLPHPLHASLSCLASLVSANSYPEVTGKCVYLESIVVLCHECFPEIKVSFFLVQVVHTRFHYFTDPCWINIWWVNSERACLQSELS